MELIGGLAFLGHYMNTRNDKTNLDKQYNDIQMNNDMNDNMYNRNQFRTDTKEYENLAKSKNELSKNPSKTGVIPRGYNYNKNTNKNNEIERFANDVDSVFSDEDRSIDSKSCPSIDMSDPTYFLNKSQKIIDNRKHERQFVKKINDNNNFTRQFDSLSFDNPSAPVSVNAIPYDNSMNSALVRMENERDIALKEGFSNFGEGNNMMYGIADNEEIESHKNSMQPFFKKGANPLTRENIAKISQRKMELFSGLERPDWKHKEEQSPLFSPVVNIVNTYGTPVMTDFYESRFIPGKERRNELPFQTQKVTPGLGVGINGKGSFIGGGGDLYRVLPKTVDEIRTVNNPKLTYEGRIVDGQKGHRGPVMGEVIKKRPAKFKEYTKDNWGVKGGNLFAPKVTGEINPSTLGGANRGLSNSEHFGPAQHDVDKVTTDEMRGDYKKSFKQTFLHADAPGFYLVEGMRGRSAGNDDTYIVDFTQRGKENDYTGPIGNSHTNKSQYFNPNDVPELNMRNVHDQYDRTGKGMVPTNQHTQYFNPNDVPELNMRNVHDQYNRTGKGMVPTNQHTQYFNPNDVPELNLRNVHDQYDRTGKGMIPTNQHTQYFNPNDVPELNLRNVHDQTDRNGKAITHPIQKTQYFNPNDVPELNLRNVHDQTDRSGKAMVPINQNGQYYNPNDVPELNLRNVHDQTDRSSKAMAPINQNGQYYNPNDVPELNLRNIHDQTDRSGKAMVPINQNGQYYNPNDVPELNLRNVHDQYDRSGKAMVPINQNGQYYNPNDVPELNMRNIHNKTDRSGKGMVPINQHGQYYNPDDVPEVTLRDVHKYDDVGPMQRTDVPNSYTINYVNYTPNVTQREVTGETNYIGPGRTKVEGQRRRMDANNSQVNVTREVIAKGRAPTLSNYDKGPTTDFTEYSLKDVAQLNREHAPSLLISAPDTLPFDNANIKYKNEKWFVNDRIDSYVNENLQRNPYINNVVHKATVTYN